MLFRSHTKLEMFQDQVFCFTPRGDLIALPRGATPVDFAYAVHTDIGDSCVGAKINGKPNRLRTILQNGDQVEIVRSGAASPDPGWEQFVVTGRARSSIRRFMRAQERHQYLKLGRSILERMLASAGLEMNTRTLGRAGKLLGRKSPDDIVEAVGRGEVSGRQVVGTLARTGANDGGKGTAATRERVAAVPIEGLIPGLAVHYAECCHPLPGERIVGVVSSGRGLDIHTIDCDALQQYEEDEWFAAKWSQDGKAPESHVGQIDVVVVNEPGALGAVTTLIGQNSGNITNLRVTGRSIDFFEMTIDVEVRDVRHLVEIIAALRTNPSVTEAQRTKV